MSSFSLYRVVYQLEKSGKRSQPDTFTDTVLAADQSPATIQTVLSNNSKIPTGHTLVIVSISHIGHNFLQ